MPEYERLGTDLIITPVSLNVILEKILCQSTTSVVIVLDGLDQCSDLRTLEPFLSSSWPHVKLFLTSRSYHDFLTKSSIPFASHQVLHINGINFAGGITEDVKLVIKERADCSAFCNAKLKDFLKHRLLEVEYKDHIIPSMIFDCLRNRKKSEKSFGMLIDDNNELLDEYFMIYGNDSRVDYLHDLGARFKNLSRVLAYSSEPAFVDYVLDHARESDMKDLVKRCLKNSFGNLNSLPPALFRRLRKNKVLIKDSDGTLHDGSRDLLELRSGFFEGYFSYQSMINVPEERIVDLPDLTPATVEFLLDFVHNRPMDASWRGDYSEIFNAADKYLFKDLKEELNRRGALLRKLS